MKEIIKNGVITILIITAIAHFHFILGEWFCHSYLVWDGFRFFVAIAWLGSIATTVAVTLESVEKFNKKKPHN